MSRSALYYKEHREKAKKEANSWNKEYRRLALEHYGGSPPRCQCCNESFAEFLGIDHIKDLRGMKLDRKASTTHPSFRGGAATYRWLVKNNFPSGFRVLCHNCNFSRGHYGYCPHEKLREEGNLNERESILVL